MNTLILPKHVAERRIKQAEKEKKVKKKPLEEMSLPNQLVGEFWFYLIKLKKKQKVELFYLIKQ